MAETQESNVNDEISGNSDVEVNNSQTEIDREEIKAGAIDGLLKDLGVSSTKDLKSIIEAKNKADKENQTDLENAKSELQKTNESNKSLNNQIKSLQAVNAVLKAGVVTDHIDDVTVLAQAKVDKGEAKTFDKAVEKVLANNPQFKNQPQVGSDGTAVVNNNVTSPNESKKSSISDMIEKLNAGRITK